MDDIITGLLTALSLIANADRDVIDITLLTIRITFSSVLISTIISLPIGAAIAFREFRGKKTVISIIQTLYALPTVIVGLFCYMLLSRTGPLGFLGFLFTPNGMIFGQTFLVIPIMIGLTVAALHGIDPVLSDTVRTLGANRFQFLLAHMREARFAIMAAVVVGFSRALSEVGTAIMIGGNIKGFTRVLTTAISLQTSMGNFEFSLALGIILLSVALVINLIMGILQHR